MIASNFGDTAILVKQALNLRKAFILYYLKYIWEVSQTLDYIHRFIYIGLMKGHVTGGATFHQGVLLDCLH